MPVQLNLNGKSSMVIWWQGAVLIGCAALTWLTFAQAVVTVTRDSNPKVALQLNPNDPSAAANLVDISLSNNGVSRRDFTSYKNASQRSLIAQAINPKALRQLAFSADESGDQTRAQALIAQSVNTSRRDFGAQLWLIEDGVMKGDIARTLSRYDTALRANSESAAVLYPILSAALSEEAVQVSFASYIKDRPPWLVSFLSFAVVEGSSPRAVADSILQAQGMPDGDGFYPINRQLIERLVAAGDYDTLRKYYNVLKGSNKSIYTSTQFDKSTIDPRFAPITWQVSSNTSNEVSFEPVKTNNTQILRIATSSEATEVVLTKLMYLSSGMYRFEQRPKLLSHGKNSIYYWQLSCVSESLDKPLWRSDSDQYDFTIPEFCDTQNLELLVSGSAGRMGAEITIQSIDFRRRLKNRS